MIRKIDHIAVAVPDLQQALSFWSGALGLDSSEIETVESEQVRVALLPVGATRIELVEATEDESPVGRFIESRGGGIHHMTFEVNDLPQLLKQLQERGVRLIGDGMRVGAGGRKVAFLHPKSAGGVLVELVAAPESVAAPRDVEAGQAVLLYLRDPQEKLWGVLRRLDATGAVLEGLDLGSFDTWLGQLERDEPDIVGPSIVFVPMTRLEKILLDRSSGPLPSMAERFEARIGQTIQELLDAD